MCLSDGFSTVMISTNQRTVWRGLLAYLVAVVPEEVVGFLPGVPHHTGQVESAAQLHVDLRAAHDLSSGL